MTIATDSLESVVSVIGRAALDINDPAKIARWLLDYLNTVPAHVGGIKEAT